MRKPLLLILALLAIAALAGAGWQVRRDPAPQPPQTAAVTRGDVHRAVLATGTIEAASLVSVGAQVGGQIQSLPVKLGQVLAPGDLVAQIDPQEQQTDLARAEAALAQIEAQILALKANIEQAESAQSRRKTLNDKGLGSTQDLETAEAQLQVNRANLKAAEAEHAQAVLSVQSARIALERTRITAPSAGTVVAVAVREGQTINAMQSSPTVIKLADLATMVVKTEISEADVIHVRPGQHADFTLSGAPEMRFDAVLREVEPAPSAIATADTVDTTKAIYYNALLEVPNPKGVLRIGMSADVTIRLGGDDGVLVVPAGALTTDAQGRSVVRVWDAARAATTERVVETGTVTPQDAAILSGLSEGERVLTAPDDAPADGGRPRRGPGFLF